MRTLLLLLVVLLASPAQAESQIDVLAFDSPEQAAAYRTLIDELRCPKCLNTNLAGSDAPIASDLRREVYRQLKGGKDEAAVRAFMLERYGDFILYRPRFSGGGLVLWLAPVLMALGGVWLIWHMARSRRRVQVELTEAERAEARSLLQ